MKNVRNFIQEFFPKRNLSIKQYSKGGDSNINNNDIASTINKTYIINVKDEQHIYEVYESILNKNSSVTLKEAIIPIESMIPQGKYPLAIQKYEELIALPSFNEYSKNERFLVYNGILNCHINNGSNESTIDYWSNKIKALGKDIDEIHRYYFLIGIREYNKQNFDKAIILFNQSIAKKDNYIHAITMKTLVRLSKCEINYKEAKSILNDLLNKKGLEVTEYASIHSSLGDIAFISEDYNTSKKQYIKAYNLSENLGRKISISISKYFLSFSEIKEDGRVDLDKIDFESLKIAEDGFEEIFKNKDSDTVQTIVNLAIPYYFNILALNSNHEAILNIYNEIKNYLSSSSIDTLYHVVEAQIINEILDEELIAKFSEIEQIKFEALYYEKINDYDKVIDLLTPLFESEYKDDKVIQLMYLNALKEKDFFDKYMHYYQKFKGNSDEVMRMNYIQYLSKKGERESLLTEIKEIKEIAKNGFVLYDLLYIYLDYNLETELSEFFDKVESGTYNIIGFHKPFVFYQHMIHLLNNKKYAEFFNFYETTDLSFLSNNNRLRLKINYFTFKHDIDNLAKAFYEFFLLTKDHNELIKAVQMKLQINEYYDAFFYLEQVNPMMLEEPEYFYMFMAIILKEKGEIEQAFLELQRVIDELDIDINSPFHQFYTAFNMSNNRTDVACRYMGEYYAKNPNPDWFKVIKHSENDTGTEIIEKLEAAVGGKRDLSDINHFFCQGVIGVSVYNKIVGTEVEEMLLTNRYPFTRLTISRGNVQETLQSADTINNKLIVDSTTLIILAATESLPLLDVFSEIIVPYTTIFRLTENNSGIFSTYSKKALAYVNRAPKIHKLAVDEAMKIKGRDSEVLLEDTLDCIALTMNLKTPFLNTEISTAYVNKSSEIIDVNALFIFLKENHPEKKKEVSKTIANMRKMGLDFISFNANDMYNVYKLDGVEGISPFLKMGKNADYKTFTAAYTDFLKHLYVELPKNEFKICCSEIIKFMDKYIGKTKYYFYEIKRKYPHSETAILELIKKPSVKSILIKKALYDVILLNEDYPKLVDTFEFQKIVDIAYSFMIFLFQYASLFSESPKDREEYIQFLKENSTINNADDIDYILQLMDIVKEKHKDLK